MIKDLINITKNRKYDGYQWVFASIVYKLFDKKTSGGNVESENMQNQELSEKLHKPIIRKFEKLKVYSSSINNIYGADLAYMQLFNKFNKGNCFW